MAEFGKPVKYQNEIDVEVDTHHRHCSQPVPSFQNKNAKRPKTAAERMREYRARKKNQIQSASKVSSIVHHQDSDIVIEANGNIKSVHEFTECRDSVEYQNEIAVEVDTHQRHCSQPVPSFQNKNVKRPKTAAERMREYRARKKNQIQSASKVSSIIHHQDSNIVIEANGNVKSEHEFTESRDSMEYQNEIIVKVDVQRRRCCQTDPFAQNANAKVLKIAAQYMREYRARKSNKKGRRPKTAMERMREYRRRKRNKIQSTSDLPSIGHHQDDTVNIKANDFENVPEYTDLSNGNANAGRATTAAAAADSVYTSGRTGKKLYKCKRCEYSASELSSLKTHLQIHTGRKPHKCEQCEYRTSRLSHLQNHIRTHTGEKPYKCEQCEYSASLLKNLQWHMHKHTGEKPYKCQQCEYSAPRLDNLKRHIRRHTGEKPYKCEHCEYSSSQVQNLRRHTRSHRDERPYKCSRCEYSTFEINTLQRHIRIHTDETIQV